MTKRFWGCYVSVNAYYHKRTGCANQQAEMIQLQLRGLIIMMHTVG